MGTRNFSDNTVEGEMPACEIKTNKTILIVALGCCICLAAILMILSENKNSFLFFIGVCIGVTLLHASFGFAGAWKQFVLHHKSAGIRASILLIGFTSLFFFPLMGNVSSVINVSPAVAPVGISLVVGAFLFGIGMQLAGGCGSGTLFTVGGGQFDMLITLVFFICGSTIGSAHLQWWVLQPSIGEISLIESAGWPYALIFQLFLLGGLYWLVRRTEFVSTGQILSITENTMRVPKRHRIIFGPWPLLWAVGALVILSVSTLLIAGHTWSITFAFGLWGAKIWNAVGGTPDMWAYWEHGYPAQALSSSVLFDTTSVMNIGIVLGAAIAASLAGKFVRQSTIEPIRMVSAVVGGLMLGYGARLAFGCNIGALYAGISSGSVHGWVWLVAAFLGSMMGIKFREYLNLAIGR